MPSVLVVEDDEQINALVGAYVELCGYAYQHAYNGTAAMAAVDGQAPCAVVLDLMLPDIDGYEVCRRMRSQAATAKTPIIILSAMGSEADRQRGRDCGANEHLTKPFDPDQLIRVLNNQVRCADAD